MRQLLLSGCLGLFLSAAAFGQGPQVDFGVEDQGGFVAIASGGSITVQAAAIGQPTTVRLRIRSLAAAPMTVGAIQISNTRFALPNLPALPATLAPGATLEFDAVYTPASGAVASTVLSVVFQVTGSPPASAALGIVGRAPSFRIAYAVGEDGNTLPLADGGNVAFPSTAVNAASVATFILANVGSGPGLVDAISLETGDPWRLQSLPLLPLLVPSGEEIRFLVRFAPTQRGSFSNTLTMNLPGGPVRGQLSGVASAPQLTYELVLPDETRTITPGSAVQLPQTPAGGTLEARVRVRNTGDASTVVTSFALSGGALSLSEVPIPPVTLAPAASLEFALRYAPVQGGESSGRLTIGTAVFDLLLSARGLPAYSFTGAPAQVGDLQQPTVGLALNAAYPIALQGTLTLGFLSETFGIDPAVQFVTGGTRVSFTIPAGSTEAVFQNGSNRIRFQTGSVAGTLTLTPAFVAGGIDLTPVQPPILELRVAPAAPRVLSFQIGSLSTTSVTLVVNGSTSTRTLREISFTFTPLAGAKAKVDGTSIPINVEASSDIYFRSSASTPFGGLFQASIPFSINGGTNIPALAEIFESVTVTLTNSVGPSSTATVPLR